MEIISAPFESGNKKRASTGELLAEKMLYVITHKISAKSKLNFCKPTKI